MFALVLSSLLSASWQPLSVAGSSGISRLHALGDTLVACGAGGCASTADGGTSWARHGAAAAPEMSPVFGSSMSLMELEYAVARSLDQGRTWSPWNEGIAADQTPGRIAVQGDVAFLSTWTTTRSPGLISTSAPCSWYVRTRTAAKWTWIGSANSGVSCDDIAIGYAGSLWRTAPSHTGNSTIVAQRSLDQGKTWDSVLIGASVRNLGHGTLALESSLEARTVVTTDSGRTWNFLTPGLSVYMDFDGAILPEGSEGWVDLGSARPRVFSEDSLGRVRLWERIGSTLWAYGDYGLFASRDSGRTWTRADRNYPLGLTAGVLWHDDRLLQVAQFSRRQKLLQSLDGGRTWSPLTDWIRGGGALEDCPEGPVTELLTGTLHLVGGQARIVPSETAPSSISCDDSRTLGLDGSTLLSWNGTSWTSLPAKGLARGISLATTPQGIFFEINDYENDNIRIDVLLAGTDTVVRTNPMPYVRSLAGSPRGAWVATTRGLFHCTNASDCRREALPGIDSLWSFLPTSVQGPFLFAAGIPYSAALAYDYSRPRLFASADTGRTWTSLEVPGLPLSATATPEGIVANLYGQGLWLLPSDVFRTTSVGPRPARAASPALALRGRILSLTGVAPGTVAQVLDASGRTLLQTSLEVRDHQASLALPLSARGIVMVRLRSDAGIHTLRTVATGR